MVSEKSKKTKQIMFFTFLIGKNRHGIGKNCSYFSIRNGAEIRPLEKGRKSPAVACNEVRFSRLETPYITLNLK